MPKSTTTLTVGKATHNLRKATDRHVEVLRALGHAEELEIELKMLGNESKAAKRAGEIVRTLHQKIEVTYSLVEKARADYREVNV